jgi:hypothetical protein
LCQYCPAISSSKATNFGRVRNRDNDNITKKRKFIGVLISRYKLFASLVGVIDLSRRKTGAIMVRSQ